MSFRQNWNKKLIYEMGKHGEAKKDIIYCTVSDKQLAADFLLNSEYEEYGVPFMLWTHKNIYHSNYYNCVTCIPRNPPES